MRLTGLSSGQLIPYPKENYLLDKQALVLCPQFAVFFLESVVRLSKEAQFLQNCLQLVLIHHLFVKRKIARQCRGEFLDLIFKYILEVKDRFDYFIPQVL